MNFELVRITNKLTSPATLGVLLVNSRPLFCTCELPWLDNKPIISCIPDGQYSVILTHNRRLHSGSVVAVTLGVVGAHERSGILFHVGNTTKDSNGCILLGQSFTQSGNLGVAASQAAFGDFVRIITKLDEGFEYPLKIKWSGS